MADEETIQETSQEEEAPKGKKKKLPLILMLVVVLLLGGGGFFAWKFVLGAPTSVNQLRQKITGKKAKPKKPKEKKVTMGPVQPLETFIVNLASDKGERYLKVTMNIELNNDKVVQEVVKRTPQLRDAIILLLSSKRFQDISKLEGKEILKREILARINSFLIQGKARRVYFTEFVVQ